MRVRDLQLHNDDSKGQWTEDIILSRIETFSCTLMKHWTSYWGTTKTLSYMSTFSEKGDQRMSGSRFLYVTICSSLRLIIALHLCMMFFHIFLFVLFVQL